MTRAQQIARGVVLLAATMGVSGAVVAGQSAAASCSAIDISAGRNLTFNVSSVYVAKGGCVRFANLTDVTVTVRVSGSSFSERLPARTPASASRSFIANKSADVTATDGVRNGRGRINVADTPASTSATPTPTQSQIAPPVKPTTTPTPSPSKSKQARELHEQPLPDGVATDAAAAVNQQHQFPLPAIPSLPPEQTGGSGGGASAGSPTVSHPVVAPQIKSTDPRYTSTTLDPTSGPRRGLPAAVAAVLLLGVGAAYGRTVLVAGEAVERRPTPRPVRRTV